eukprot:3552527-Rhodomonas_salina.1
MTLECRRSEADRYPFLFHHDDPLVRMDWHDVRICWAGAVISASHNRAQWIRQRRSHSARAPGAATQTRGDQLAMLALLDVLWIKAKDWR